MATASNPRRLLTPERLFWRSALARLGLTEREQSTFEPLALEVRRHAHVMEAGQDPDTSGLVFGGVLREYYLHPDGTEHTRGFALAGQPFGSLADALSARPSRVFVRAEVDSTVFMVRWSQLGELAKKSIGWERLQAKLVEQLYLKKSEREYELLALDAMGRYLSLRQTHPTLETLVTGQTIASYLGITNIHLSRLRRRMAQNQAEAQKRKSQANTVGASKNPATTRRHSGTL